MKFVKVLLKILGIFCLIEFIICCIMLMCGEFEEHIFAGILTCATFGLPAFFLLRPKKIKDTPPCDAPALSDNPKPTAPAQQEPKESLPNHLPIYMEQNNIIVRVDNRPVTDEEIPGLIENGYKTAFEYQEKSPNPKFHRTKHEEELTFQFFEKYGVQVSKLEAKFEDAYRSAYSRTDIDEKIECLENAIRLYEKAKAFCYSKGKGGALYFDDMWEHLHNSRCQDYSYITSVYNELETFKDIKESLIPQLLNFAKDGFLQKNIYEKLDSDLPKNEVRKIIDNLVSEGLLTKEKKGNSYFIKAK